MAKKVLIYLKHRYSFWHIQERQVDVIRANFPELNIITAKDESEALKEIEDVDIYFGWHLPKHLLAVAKKLSWVHTPSAGRDYIDSLELKSRPIEFTNSEGYHGLFMAQHAMGMILYFSRGFSFNIQKFWQRDRTALEFFDLIGARMLIVGCGSIGLKLAELSKAFGMEVYGYKRNIPKVESPYVKWIKESELNNFYSKVKIVVNLLPRSEQTFHYFNAEKFSYFQNEALFINLGRGSTVDEADLLKALESNLLSGCGLDVLEKEPPEAIHPLYNHPKVLITPHSSAFSSIYLDKAVEYFCKLLKQKIES